jgi:glycosyltransferase involved in cell wall biosynthesis
LRVAIDCSAIPRQRAGAGVYTYELVRALAAVEGDHEIVAFARRGLFDDLDCDRCRVVHVEPRARASRLVWEQTRLPGLLRRDNIDVLHSPHHHTPIVARGVQRVVTFHDVTFMLLPDRYPITRRLYMNAVTRASARVADAIITPSQTVRRDVIERLGPSPGRVVAIPEAAAERFRPAGATAVETVREKYALPDGYVLSVGSLEPGKNRDALFRALARLRTRGIDCVLAVAGQRAWNADADEAMLGELSLRDRVRFLGYVADDDLPALYSGATLFAFPSLYEGFGLPVLEAMACGVPVVTSNLSATAEVAGDAALLVDPRDVDALAGAMRRLLTEDELRSSLRRRGLERAGQFSWDRTARETLDVYRRVASTAQASA